MDENTVDNVVSEGSGEVVSPVAGQPAEGVGVNLDKPTSVEQSSATQDMDVIHNKDVVVETAPVEQKPESTLNNNPIEDSGPITDTIIKANKDALNNILGKDSPLETVMTRNSFYIDGYRVMQKIVLLESFVIGCMILVFVVLFVFAQPKDRFFATTPDGRLIKLVALSEPLLQKKSIISFASEAATEVMTFGFHDYRTRLQDSSDNFTKEGWENFLEALGSAKYIDTLVGNRQVISAIPLAPPVIVAEGLSGDTYKWSVEMPLNLSIESGSEVSSKKIVVQMVIARRSRIEHDKGLGIDQWIASPYRK